jgi:hypothetical protein
VIWAIESSVECFLRIKNSPDDILGKSKVDLICSTDDVGNRLLYVQKKGRFLIIPTFFPQKMILFLTFECRNQSVEKSPVGLPRAFV